MARVATLALGLLAACGISHRHVHERQASGGSGGTASAGANVGTGGNPPDTPPFVTGGTASGGLPSAAGAPAGGPSLTGLDATEPEEIAEGGIYAPVPVACGDVTSTSSDHYLLPELDAAGFESYELSLRPDELVVYFLSDRGGVHELWGADRRLQEQPFSGPRLIGSYENGNNWDFGLSGDGKLMFVSITPEIEPQLTPGIWRSERENGQGFGAPSLFWPGLMFYPWLSPGGERLYWWDDVGIFQVIPSTQDPQSTGRLVQPHPGEAAAPTLTPDELQLYLDSLGTIYHASRASIADDFTGETLLRDARQGWMSVSWASAGGCRLYGSAQGRPAVIHRQMECAGELVDFDSTEHCGRCDRDCGGAACTDLRCEPETLADGEMDPRMVVVRDGYAYWPSHATGSIKRVPVEGGPSDIVVKSVPGVTALAVDGMHIYYTTDQGVVGRTLRAGGLNEVLATGQLDAQHIAIDGNQVYWTRTGPGGGVQRVSKLGGMPNRLIEGYDLGWPAVDRSNVFFARPGEVFRASKEGGLVATLGGLASGTGLALDSEYVYFNAADRVLRLRHDGGDGGTVALNQHATRGLVVDQHFAYWATESGNIMKGLKRGGGAVWALTSGEAMPTLTGIDAGFVYWVETVATGARIRRIAK